MGMGVWRWWQKLVAIHFAIHFATKKNAQRLVEISLRSRREFVGSSLTWTISQRNFNENPLYIFLSGKMLWQNILPQTKIVLKCLRFSIQKKVVGISWKIVGKSFKSTNSWRNSNEKNEANLVAKRFATMTQWHWNEVLTKFQLYKEPLCKWSHVMVEPHCKICHSTMHPPWIWKNATKPPTFHTWSQFRGWGTLFK